MALFDFRAVCMPYCIKRLENGKYHVLNREYKPLSFCTISNDYLEKKLPIELDLEITGKIMSQLAAKGAVFQNDMIFLYGDGTNPVKEKNRVQYYELLDILMTIRVNNLR
ncbi:hypothetical protein [Bernardetia sp.]|uniref:hypothetical protein n=1 Tax=Bernardetia sp. TaxID=1937974 RepID=UPI0025C0430F|nr:hypothetical protein [Bernardetia sp.]